MESATRPEVHWESLEQTLAQLRGVHSCRIVADDAGGIAEVHVVAEGRNVQELIKEIEALFEVQVGFIPERQKISVALLSDEKGIKEEGRVGLHSYSIQKTRDGVRVRVELAWRRGVYVGEAESSRAGEPGPVVAALAATRAGEAILAEGEYLRLEEATLARLGHTDVALVALVLERESGEIPLLGTSIVRGDEMEATIRACLDGINRQLG